MNFLYNITFRKLHIISFVLVCTALSSLGQLTRVEHYTAVDGLPNELVKAVAQNPSGYIWAATDAGLVKFDGHNFKVYGEEYFNTPYVKDLVNVDEGLIVSTDDGLYLVKPSVNEDQIEKLTPDSDEYIYLKLVYKDENDRIWTSNNQRVIKYKNGSSKVYEFPDEDRSDDFKRSFAFFEDGYGNLYTTSFPGRIHVYNENEDQFQLLELNEYFGSINHATKVRSGLVLVGSDAGLFEIYLDQLGDVKEVNKVSDDAVNYILIDTDRKVHLSQFGKGIYQYNLENNSRSLISSVNTSGYLSETVDGELLVGSDNGFYLIKDNSFTNLYPDQIDSYVQDISFEKGGRKFVTNGAAVYEIIGNGLSSSAELFYEFDGFEAYSLRITDNGIWVGGNTPEVKFINWNKQVESVDFSRYGTSVYYLGYDAYKNLWVSLNGHQGIIKYSRREGIKVYGPQEGVNATASAIYTDESGRVLLGIPDKNSYLLEYQRGDDSFEDLSVDIAQFGIIEDEIGGSFRIEDLAIDQQNRIWLASRNGLLVMDADENQYQRIDNGIYTNTTIKSLSINDQGQLWFGWSNGLSTLENDQVITYNERNGIPSKLLSFRSIRFDDKNYVWVGSNEGIGISTASSLKIPKTKTPFFNNLESSNNSLTLQLNELTLKTNDYLRLNFLSLEYPASIVDYQFKIDNLNEEWRSPEEARVVSLSNLEPGDYRIAVRARKSPSALWSDPLYASLKVNSLWYNTWWGILSIILAAVGVVLGAVEYTRARYRKRNRELQKIVDERTVELKEEIAKVDYLNKQAETVFGNVKQGIFLLDQNYTISDLYSKATEEIFEKEQLGGINFIQLMRPRLVKRDLEALEMFMKNLFNPRIKEKKLKNLNPVEQVEMYDSSAGKVNIETKYIRINFSRIRDKDKIYNILVNVTDETQTVLMQKKIDETEERNRKESEQLLSILRVEPETLSEFLDKASESIKGISERYEKEKAQDFSSLISFTFNTIHNLKGNASLIDLQLLVDKFHEIEDIIDKLRSKSDLVGNDFIKILIEVNEVNIIVENMKRMLSRISDKYGKLSTEEISSSNDVFINFLNKGLNKLSSELHKEVELEFKDQGILIPERYKLTLKDITIQLMRNSLTHGIETSKERKDHGKPEKAKIDIELEHKDGHQLVFNYKDDGKGLDLEKIVQNAVQKGLITKEDAVMMSDEDKAKLIFMDQISTANGVDQYAGRGQGMSMVNYYINRFKGSYKLDFEPGEYFKISMILPLESKSIIETAAV